MVEKPQELVRDNQLVRKRRQKPDAGAARVLRGEVVDRLWLLQDMGCVACTMSRTLCGTMASFWPGKSWKRQWQCVDSFAGSPSPSRMSTVTLRR